MRPLGEISLALLAAAQCPGTVKQLAERAQVGYTAARMKCCRLLQEGRLERVGHYRPMVLRLPREV